MKRLLLVLLCCGFFAPAALHADKMTDVKNLKRKISEHSPEIRELLDRGVIGEAATGYLVMRGELTEKEKQTVEAANKDRKEVYTILSQGTKLTPEEVGRNEAKLIFGLAKKGTWLRDANGNWSRK